MTFKKFLNKGVESNPTLNGDLSKLVLNADSINRFYSPYEYSQKNPFQSNDEPYSQPYSYHPSYESISEYLPPGYSSGRYGAPTFHHNMYSSIGHDEIPMPPRPSHGSKQSSVAMSALTLLAFLFFLNILQSCLKDQMLSMNPTVMVMTAGSGRIKKTGSASVVYGGTKELNENVIVSGNINSDRNEDGGSTVLSTPVADKIEFLTNDQGDMFYNSRNEFINPFRDWTADDGIKSKQKSN